jgi:HEAT repeat protein
MYHKAFALSRSGKMQEALESIASLRRDYPQSRYLKDVTALEADVKRMAGQPVNPAAADDDEIKLLAINGLQRSEQAVSLLEGVLAAANSLAVKKRALFVLAANEDPKARAVLLRHAKGDGNPDLQLEAIRLLVSRRDGQTSNQELRDIYNSTQDPGVRISIIDAYRQSSDKASLIAIAGNKTATVDLRGRAFNSLSELATPDELWTLYQQETDASLRSQMVSAFGSMRAIDHLTRIARTDADMAVRRRAISNLGGLRGESALKSRQALVELYGTQTDRAVKTSIISALSNTENAEALVALARKETSLDLKRELVRRISDLAPRSKVAADYLMEVIK